MPTVELTRDNFEEVVKRSGTLLIDWWASWCAPCRSFGPIYEAASDKNTDLTFAKINTETQQELAAAFNISSIPTLMIIRERVMLFSRPGALPGEALDDLIAQVRAMDMDQVRKELDEQQAEEKA